MAKGTAEANTNSTPRITGIGGVFFKCKDPKAAKAWYKEHLHLDAGPYGAKFEWRQGEDPARYGCTQWSVFGEKTTYFAPSTKEFMINYRVNDLEQLVAQLRKDGVTIVDSIDASDYGKFIHILDCEQNKVELWQPKDADYDKVVRERGK
jgi:predicted enzyme related to lactoylglutathione lyase